LSKYKKIDLTKIKTLKISERETKSDISGFSKAVESDMPVSEFLKALPQFLKAKDLLDLAEKVALAKSNKKAIIWMMGAHPIKVGLSPVMIDLIKNGFVSHLAFNGAGAIHDIEIAFFGRTSEEVAETLADGSFGMVEETPKLIFDAAEEACQNGLGFGEGLGIYIERQAPACQDQSIFRECYINDVPATVHVAIGTDTLCQHPAYDGAAMGKLSHDDFRIFAQSITNLSNGVIINIGSAVILPEVFLKALTVARNISGPVDNFTAANFDMIQHYRPNTNVIIRPIAKKGIGYSFTGHHEIMLPLLAAAIKAKYREKQ
jgi:hypothetical protein